MVSRARGVITMVPKAKSKLKPSQQTLFVLDAMETKEKKDESRWEQMQGSINLLCSKLESQEGVQT
jgi:hypothetical protein